MARRLWWWEEAREESQEESQEGSQEETALQRGWRRWRCAQQAETTETHHAASWEQVGEEDPASHAHQNPDGQALLRPDGTYAERGRKKRGRHDRHDHQNGKRTNAGNARENKRDDGGSDEEKKGEKVKWCGCEKKIQTPQHLEMPTRDRLLRIRAESSRVNSK